MKYRIRLILAVLLFFRVAGWRCSENADDITGNQQLSGLRAQSASLLADGISQITLAATVLDSSGYPLQGSQVAFATSAGSITAKAYTDQYGEAQALLISEASVNRSTATVTAKIVPAEDGRIAGAIAGVESLEKDGSRISALQKSTGASAAAASLQIPFLGVT